MMRPTVCSLLVAVTFLLSTGALDAAEAPTRPKLTLVLSGGGARGAAHIGVLKVLEEKHVVPDMIIGTSMGSIVGGLYAAGYSPQEIEDILAEIDWNEVFFDAPPRRDRTFRRKQDDDVFLIPSKLRFKGMKVYLPAGVLGGQRLDLTLRAMVAAATSAQDFDDLTIPYRAIAMDLGTGEAVVLGEGSLAEAMRASMSVPGAFPPVVRAGRTLVDGGAAANLPIGIAQSLGADRLIAVDITSPLETEVEGRSFMGVLNQLSSLLTVGNREADLKRMKPGDLLIRPDLKDIQFDDFAKAREAVGIGEAAARAKLSELDAFASDDATWAAFEKRHVRSDLHQRKMRDLKLVNDSWVDDRVIKARLDVPAGEPIDRESLERQLVLLSGLDYFGILRPELQPVGTDQVDLTLYAPKKPYSRGSLQFGLSLDTDLAGQATFTLIARHRVMAVNTKGGEWKNTAQVGSAALLATEFYQPFDWGMRWFFAPSLHASRRTQALWVDGSAVGNFKVVEQEARIDVGRVFAEKSEVRLGFFRGQERYEQTVGLPIDTDQDNADYGGFRAGFRVDTAEAAAFPSKGATMSISVERDLAAFGAEEDSTIYAADLAEAVAFRGSTFTFRFAGSNVVDGATTLRTAAVLGGLGRLSGLGTNELYGERGGFVGVTWYQRLTEIPLGSFKNRIFVGMSVEAGNTYLDEDPITWSSLRTGGAVFLGAATPLGPAYFGWGWTEPDRSRWYVVIGERF